MKTLYRREKISMFLMDYYYGHEKWMTILRVIGGPLIILIGIELYKEGFDKISVAYSGFCILFGVYMIIKPFMLILFQLDNFKTENVDIKFFDDFLTIKDEQNEFKIGFKTIKKISDKQHYFLFVISRTQRLRIPKRLIENDEQEIVRNIIKTTNLKATNNK